MDIPTLLVGNAAGLVLSLFSWWLVTRAIVPKIEISPKIGKLADPDSPSGFRYRIKIRNAKRWWLPRAPAVDVALDAYLAVRGLMPGALRTRDLITIPIPNQLAMLSIDRVIRLRLAEIAPRDLIHVPTPVRAAIAAGTVTLEELLSLGSEAELRLIVSATHSYTQGRRTKIARYKLHDIFYGRFEFTGVEAVPEATPAPTRAAVPDVEEAAELDGDVTCETCGRKWIEPAEHWQASRTANAGIALSCPACAEGRA